MAKKNNINISALFILCSYIALASQQGQLINDTLQAQDKVFSSKHVTDLINSMSEQDKKYVDDIVANLNKLSSKTTSVIPDSSNAEPNTLYLYSADPNPTSYNQYMVLSDKTILDLGTTNISLEGYLKETDADSKYLKQVDAHTHSNKSTIDNLTQSVIDNINNLNIEVDGTSYTQDGDGKIALPNYPTIPNIANTLTSTSTNDEVAGALAVYNSAIKDKNLKSFVVLSQLGLVAGCSVEDVFMATPEGSMVIINVTSSNVANVPSPHGVLIIIKHASRQSLLFKVSGIESVLANELYIGQIKGSDGTGLVWNKVISSDDLRDTKIMYLDCGGEFSHTHLGVDHTNTITEVVRAFGNYIINTYGKKQYAILEFSTNNNSSNFNISLPNDRRSCLGTVKYMPWQHINRIQIILTDLINGNTYIGSLNNNDTDDIVWQKVCTTKVADVAKTAITLSDETNYKNSASCESFYIVKNGTCFVTLAFDCVSPTSDVAICNLPPAYGVVRFSMARAGGAMDGYILPGGELKISGGTANTKYYIVSFSYPVAES